jgi:hypothetical protein
MPDTPRDPDARLTRAEQVQLAAAALRGILAGAARAAVSFLIEEGIHR